MWLVEAAHLHGNTDINHFVIQYRSGGCVGGGGGGEGVQQYYASGVDIEQYWKKL